MIMIKIDEKTIESAISYLPIRIQRVIRGVIKNKKLSNYYASNKILQGYNKDTDEYYHGTMLYDFVKGHYKMVINIELDEKDRMIAILHELIHVWQYESKYDWVLEINSSDFSYEDNPMEKEAIRKSIRYYSKKRF